MPYISEARLKMFQPTTYFANERSRQLLAKYGTATARLETTIFLSHSHNDRSLIQAAVKFLTEHNVRVYVDWLDEEMPTTVSEETAEKLKVKIEAHRKFILLATKNSKDSKWVPWELGYADKTKGFDHLAVLPISEAGGWDFQGTEYVGIYPKIIEHEPGNFIVWCSKPNKWEKLQDWLKRQ